MVQIRPLEESGRRWVEGCIKAFLEGEQNENWIRSILPSTEEGLNEVRTALNLLQGYGDPTRRRLLREFVGLS